MRSLGAILKIREISGKFFRLTRCALPLLLTREISGFRRIPPGRGSGGAVARIFYEDNRLLGSKVGECGREEQSSRAGDRAFHAQGGMNGNDSL